MPRHERERSPTALRASLVLGAAASAIVCYFVATQSLVLGSPAGGWFYGYQQVFSVRFLGVFAAACAAGALLWLPAPRPGLDEWSRLLAWCAVALGVQWLLRSIAPFSLESLFTSDSANGFYGFAQQQTPGDLEPLRPSAPGGAAARAGQHARQGDAGLRARAADVESARARLAGRGAVGRRRAAPLRLHERAAARCQGAEHAERSRSRAERADERRAPISW